MQVWCGVRCAVWRARAGLTHNEVMRYRGNMSAEDYLDEVVLRLGRRMALIGARMAVEELPGLNGGSVTGQLVTGPSGDMAVVVTYAGQSATVPVMT